MHSTLQLLLGAPANGLSCGFAYFFTPINVFASGSVVSALVAPSALAYLPAFFPWAVATIPTPYHLQGFLARVSGKSTPNLPFCEVPGRQTRITQSAARTLLNQWSRIWDLFVSFCPARWYWASPLGAYAVPLPVSERQLVLLTSLLKGFRCYGQKLSMWKHLSLDPLR